MNLAFSASFSTLLFASERQSCRIHGALRMPWKRSWSTKEGYVTNYLYVALKYLQLQHEDRVLWIDAVCIDQNNKPERGHQVQQMADIYHQADRVIFWLGAGTYETKVLMDSLNALDEETRKHSCRRWKSADSRWMELWSQVQPDLREEHTDLAARQVQGLDFILKQPWFTRV